MTIRQVIAFIDWNSQIHAINGRGSPNEITIASYTLQHVSRVIGLALGKDSGLDRFEVSLRLYHGWHKGFEPTVRRKAAVTAIASADFPTLARKPDVIIRSEVVFGDYMYSALECRLHHRINCHLPNTVRDRSHNSLEEKLIDTSIASDIVDIAHREPDTWLLLIGDDDDLIPAAFAAEAAASSVERKVYLIRDRLDSPFYKLSNLSLRPQ